LPPFGVAIAVIVLSNISYTSKKTSSFRGGNQFLLL